MILYGIDNIRDLFGHKVSTVEKQQRPSECCKPGAGVLNIHVAFAGVLGHHTAQPNLPPRMVTRNLQGLPAELYLHGTVPMQLMSKSLPWC